MTKIVISQINNSKNINKKKINNKKIINNKFPSHNNNYFIQLF